MQNFGRSIGLTILFSSLSVSVCAVPAFANIHRFEQPQKFYRLSADPSSQACSSSPEGVEIYKFIIFNDLLSNPDFGDPEFSARPYWDNLQRNPESAVASLFFGDAVLAEYLHRREFINPEEETQYYDTAIAAYRYTLRITEAPSTKGDANLGLGRVYALKRQYREAMAHFQKTLEIAQNEILPGATNGLEISANA